MTELERLERRLQTLKESDFLAERSDNAYYRSGRKEENRRAQKTVQEAIDILRRTHE